MRRIVYALGMTLFCTPAFAADYTVDYANSRVSFAGEHAGSAFDGVFEEWSADVHFDPADLAGSSLKASFDLASAKTGNKMFDGTLPEKDWFHVAAHPKGHFESNVITVNEDGSYKAEGLLTLRGIEKPLSFDFTLSDLAVAPVQVSAQFPIERLAYDIGRESDPGAEWVSANITVTLDITASPDAVPSE